MRRFTIRRAALPLLLLFTMHGFASVEAPPQAAGTWSLSFGKRTLLVLTLKAASSDHQPFSGTLSRPQHLQTSDAASFSHISGNVEVEPIIASEWKRDGLFITVRNPADPKDTDSYLFNLTDSNHALLKVAGWPIPPMSLTRASGMISVTNDWDPDRTYSPDDNYASNPEMKRIFDEDQKVRQPGFRIDWVFVHKSDAERRQATLKLLKAGALHTGEDFDWASFVFQHGSGPDDYLLAHTLAIIAVKKGNAGAIWMTAATLDRYLQSIKQPQIYGTQFNTPDDLPTTQQPYNRTLISDALRQQLGVPPLSAQEAQRKQYDSLRKPAK